MNTKTTIPGKFLTSCELEPETKEPVSFTMVIFGGTSNLSRTKLIPALFSLYRDNAIKDFTIIALGRTKFSTKQYQKNILESLKKSASASFSKKIWTEFSNNIQYQILDSNEPKDYASLFANIDSVCTHHKCTNLLYYLALPPAAVPDTIRNLGQENDNNKHPDAKIIVEKPFGKDQSSAIKLNKTLLKYFDEQQIYRIDHYLGKETVQNLLFFRFSNSIFEPLWNRRYIDHVQITVAEDIGIQNRAGFYEDAGVIRDIVQNHIMQLLTLVAMEPPVGFDADMIRDEKVKVLRSIRLMQQKTEILQNTCIGQYKSYRQEPKVAPDSLTPTYFAGKFYIDNWRWAGVPFYVRTGKKLKTRNTEIKIEFKSPPIKLLGRVCEDLTPNTLLFKIQPQEEINLQFSVKYPYTIAKNQTVNMVFNYDDAFAIEHHEAYERLLTDCMKGDQTLFARQDEVETNWSIVDPIIKTWEKAAAKQLAIYSDNSNGPKTADQLIQRDKRLWLEL